MIQFPVKKINILIFCIALFSCQNKDYKLNDDTTKIEYYKNGHIKAINVSSDKMGERLILTFDSSGSLNMYKNIKQNDVYNQLLFFPSGNLSQKISIKKGQIEGTCITFYESGNIETLRFLMKGKETLDGIDYYDGPFMRAKAVVYFNDSGNVYYKEYFDLNGKLIDKEGTP